MNKRIALGVIAGLLFTAATEITATSCDSKSKCDRSRTFFMPRSENVNLAMEMPLWHKATARDKERAADLHFQGSWFYANSTNGDDLRDYFFFKGQGDCKGELRIGVGDNADIHPAHFNLPDGIAVGQRETIAHEETFTIDPEREVYGLRLDMHKEFWWLLRGLYVSGSTTLVHLSHNPDLCSTVVTQGSRGEGNDGYGPNNIREAFAGVSPTTDFTDQMKYGKIDGSHSLSGAADIDFKIGYRALNMKRYKAAINLGLTIPTTDEPRAEYLFEPTIGYAGHFALGFGVDGDFMVWQDMERENSLKIIVYGNYRYLFDRSEYRTLGLKNKNWGQYIKMLKQDPADSTRTLGNAFFGTNVLTHKVSVEPGSQINLMADISLKISSFLFDIGYDFWWRESDDIDLKCGFEQKGVFGLLAADVPVLDNGNGTQSIAAGLAANTVSSATTIKEFGAADGVFLQKCDLSLKGQDSAATHKIFGNVGVQIKGNHPILAGLGASYEFADEDALEQWQIWLKLAVSC